MFPEASTWLIVAWRAKEELNAATALGNTFFITLFHTHECPSTMQHINSNRQALGKGPQ